MFTCILEEKEQMLMNQTDQPVATMAAAKEPWIATMMIRELAVVQLMFDLFLANGMMKRASTVELWLLQAAQDQFIVAMALQGEH